MPLFGCRTEVVTGQFIKGDDIGITRQRPISLRRGTSERIESNLQTAPPSGAQGLNHLAGSCGLDGSGAAQVSKPAGMGEERAEGVSSSARPSTTDQVTDSAHQTAPDQPEPHQGQGLARCMAGDNQHAEQPIDLARPPTGEAVRAEPGSTYLTVGDLRTRRGDDAVAVQVSTPTKPRPSRRTEVQGQGHPDAHTALRTNMPQVDTPSRS
jgi:hypothetical protein